MKIINTSLEGVFMLEPQVFSDSRGYFMETFQQRRYSETGLDRVFVQDNFSCSSKRTLRGLHYQLKHAQAKLVQVTSGRVFDVAVDVRDGSPTFGQWTGAELSAENNRQLFIPEGFAHGFCVLSDTAHFIYKCSDYYFPEDECGIIWSDPAIGIDWPVSGPLLSEKDEQYPCLKDVPKEFLPPFIPTKMVA